MDPKSRGLGRGLNALFEDDEEVYPQVDPEGPIQGRARNMVGIDQLEPGPGQPRTIFDDKALDAFVGFRPYEGRVGNCAVRDPHLRAVEDPVLAVAFRMRLHVARVGTAMRLSKTKTADGFAFGHGR